MQVDNLDIDPEQKRDELISDAQDAAGEAKAEQQAILEAVKNDEEVSHDTTEWVEVGDAEFKVRTTLSGRVLDILQAFEGDEMPPMDNIVEAAILQTEKIRTEDSVVTDPDTIESFWQSYYDEYGAATIDVVSERIIAPGVDNHGVDQSFRR